MVSTVLSSFCEVQFNGYAISSWYSQVPLDALQKARLGRTVEGNDVMRGVKVQFPIDAAIVSFCLVKMSCKELKKVHDVN
jgi:hypothetical protein